MNRRILCLSILWLLGLSLDAGAQGIITGTVIDARSLEPLIGAQVAIPYLVAGSVTNVDGIYRIAAVPAGDYTVEFRYIGYRTSMATVTVVTGETVVLDASLNETAINLDEVVVTGAGGPVEKRKLGNSIATIATSSLETAPVQTFSDVLQGREPGLVGMPSGGQTGEGARIRIRGAASLSQSNEPIVYIDGIRANNGGGITFNPGGSPSRLDDINPEAIERVEILKGAAAATLFGSEASNGVIQIFTKRGNIGPPHFTFQTQQASITYPRVYANNAGFARTQTQADTMATWFGRSGLRPFQLVEENFMQDLFEPGYGQVYSASVSGGASGITYYASARWSDEDGPFGGKERRYPTGVRTLVEDLSKRVQTTANLNIFPTESLQFRVTSNYVDSYLQTMASNNNIYGVPSLAQFSKPELVRFNNETGSTAFATVNESMQRVIEQNVRRFVGSVGANYQPLDFLIIDGTFGVDFTSQKDTDVRGFRWNIDNFSGSTPDGERQYRNSNRVELTFDVKGTVQKQLSPSLESTFLFGSQGFIAKQDILQGIGTNFPGPGFNVTGAAAVEDIFEFFEEVVNVGVFFQEQAGWRNMLYMTVGGRLDANSAFGSNFSSIFYPKISVSFIPSDANFWQYLGPVSSLRFRAALGQSGLQPGAFDALTTYGSFSSQSGPGIVPNNLGNAELKPEISTEWELGLEAGLFDDRLAVETTYWDRVVRDALVTRQFPVSGGFRATQLDNIGELKGKGVELAINALVYNSPSTSVSLFANTAYLWEQITNMGGAPPIKVGGSYPRYRNYLVEGYAPGTNFGARLLDVPNGSLPVDLNKDGIPDTESDLIQILGALTPTTAELPNTTSLVLLQPNPDPAEGLSGNLTHFLGKPAPDFAGSVGGSVKFLHNFTLTTLFEYKTGNYFVNNLTGAFRQANPIIGRNTPASAQTELDFLSGGADANGNPQNSGEIRLDALKRWLNNELALSPFSGLNTIKEADFIRWREVSLTYSIPRSLVQRVNLRSLSISVSGRNLAIWTKYDGVDPELNAIGRGGGESTLSQNFLDGVEAFGWAIPRRILFTMRLGF